MNDVTVIIGAGIAGLLTAHRLKEAGAKVLVLEKSRGFGGRMATKRVGLAVFDQGTQYFSAFDPAFVRLVDEWRERGWAEEREIYGQPCFVGRPCMTAIPRGLAAGLRVLRDHRVTAARRHECGCWELDVEGHGLVRAERLLLTCPVPQALAVLDAGGVRLPDGVRPGLESIVYQSCLTLMLTLDGPSGLPAAGMAPVEGPVRWLTDNTLKGVSAGASAVTVQATPEFSRQYYAAGEPEVAALLLPAIKPLLRSEVVSTSLHRWRFSEPQEPYHARSLWLPELTLGFAGDSFGGASVEGAALSGLELADAVKKDLQPGTTSAG